MITLQTIDNKSNCYPRYEGGSKYYPGGQQNPDFNKQNPKG